MGRTGVSLGLALMAIASPGCGTSGDPWSGETAPVRVVVTIPALESMVRAVGGERVAVRSLCTREGPHGYKADTADLALFARAHLFLAVGLSLDDTFATDLFVRSRRGKEGLKYVKVGQLLPADRIRKMEHGTCPEGHEGHSHGKHDPHVWLGIPEARLLAGLIQSHLAEADPDGAAEYKKNAAAFQAELDSLMDEGKKKLGGKKASLITFHDSFGYFANAFGLHVAAVMEVTPGDNPDSHFLKKIAEVALELEKGGEHPPVRAITVEPQYEKGSVSLLHKQLQAQGLKSIEVVTVDPLETGEPAELRKEGGGWYVQRMRANIEALARALP